MAGRRDAGTRDADAIVIGSGMGGLAAAAILARVRGMRVLVLERHWRAGGFTQTFSRPGGFRWDVGVHYVGAEAARQGMARDVLQVTTGGALAWSRMPDPFERLVFPGFEFEIRSGRERFAEDLARVFPAEASGVRAYLRDVDRAASATVVNALRGTAPAPAAAIARWLLAGRLRLARRTTKEVLDARFEDERLEAVLGARWGDHGLPPGRKDPQARAHTAEVGTAVDATDFERWAGTRWKKRGPDYDALKERIADALMLGVTGAAMSGLMTAVAATGPSTFRRVREAARALDASRVTSAEVLPSGGTRG